MKDTVDRVTIDDVALEAEVSKATVSRVLNRPSNVADDTVDRVRSAIDKLGFTPNSTARRLSLTTSRTEGEGRPVQNEAEASLIVTFEGSWTNSEKESVLGHIAEHGEEGVWVGFKTEFQEGQLFVLLRREGADWMVRTGNTIQSVVAQL